MVGMTARSALHSHLSIYLGSPTRLLLTPPRDLFGNDVVNVTAVRVIRVARGL